MEQTTWPVRVSRAVGTEVRRHRTEQKLTVQALADACAQLGLPLGRVTITKLEGGSREGISVPELITLAAALGVAPADLLIPAGDGTVPVELLPGSFWPPDEAARWFGSGLDTATLGIIRSKVAELSRLVARAHEMPAS